MLIRAIKFNIGKYKRRGIGVVQFSTKIEKTALETAYKPALVENAEKNCLTYFKTSKRSDKTFSMILPPPNITGDLHLGHALTATIQDAIIRWKALKGINCVWIPGLDHAGIATQVIVEKILWTEKQQTRHNLGRELFQNRIWKWKDEKTATIETQLRHLGLSLTWDRQVFTMDAERSNAVNNAFIQLFESGLIYRADHLVNWSCTLQSAISDIEVEHLECDGPREIHVPNYEKPVEFGTLTYFAYKLYDSDEEIVVATTRPETVLGDVAVAVNPRDGRYSSYIGRNLWHPFRKQTIPIICDDFVDPNFGTGAVKVTPAHDPTDFEVGKRHNLDLIQVIDEKGNLTSLCGELAGISRFDARNKVVSLLQDLELFREKRGHKTTVPICSRSKDVLEYLVKPQWFISCRKMAEEAADDVRSGRLTIEPKLFEKNWFNWLENIRDWCVSRQLWWGHRVPVYLCKTVGKSSIWVAAVSPEEALTKAASTFSVSSSEVVISQDEDVLDTWFSSAILPFTAFGWPKEESLEYYPLSLMETGHDILFFWVARMVMLGKKLTGTLPFNKILLHGIICDSYGRKMSKSLGNVVAPESIVSGITLEQLETKSRTSYESGILSKEELTKSLQGQKKMFAEGIPECGADALRFTLCSHNIKSHFINFDVQECYTNKLFCNKIWQATRYTNAAIDKIEGKLEKIDFSRLGQMDRWILSRLSFLLATAKVEMEEFEFHTVTAALKRFLYFEFCDIYLEATKRAFKLSQSEIAVGHCWTLTKSLDTALKVLAPFMPHLAQHLHIRLKPFPGEKKTTELPESLSWHDEILEREVADMLEVVVGIRRLKKIFGVAFKHNPEVYIITSVPFYSDYVSTIQDLSACCKVSISSSVDESVIKTFASDRIGTNVLIYLRVPPELLKAVELDLPKLESKKAKLIKEVEKMNEITGRDSYKLKTSAEVQTLHAKKISSLQEQLARISYLQTFCKH